LPSQCVWCCKDNPDGTTMVMARDAGMGQSNLAKGWDSVNVPCCLRCQGKLHTARIWRTIRLVVLAIGFGFGPLLIYHGFDVNRMFAGGATTGLICFGLAVAAIIGSVVWDAFHPLPFNLEFILGKLDYKFKDKAYAQKFAELNNVEVPPEWKSTNPS